MKTAFITGATGTIGEAIAYDFAKRGYHLTLLGRSKEKLTALRELFAKQFPTIDCQIQCIHFLEQNEMHACFTQHVNHFKTPPTVVIHTAATQNPIGPLWELDDHKIDEALRINLLASFYVTKAAVQSAIQHQTICSIILFSGGGACYARPFFSVYGTTKTAVLRLVETIAEELKNKKLDQEIQINALAPGAVFSNMTRDIIAAGYEKAGERALVEASQLNQKNSPDAAVKLCAFLADRAQNGGLNGRLVHANEPYQHYAAAASQINASEQGLLRRVPINE